MRGGVGLASSGTGGAGEVDAVVFAKDSTACVHASPGGTPAPGSWCRGVWPVRRRAALAPKVSLFNQLSVARSLARTVYICVSPRRTWEVFAIDDGAPYARYRWFLDELSLLLSSSILTKTSRVRVPRGVGGTHQLSRPPLSRRGIPRPPAATSKIATLRRRRTASDHSPLRGSQSVPSTSTAGGTTHLTR